MATISRNEYVGLYGPTVGDRIRLGDTGLFVEVERDLRGGAGDEREIALVPFGGRRAVFGFNNLVDGPTAGKDAAARKSKAVKLASKRGFRSASSKS